MCTWALHSFGCGEKKGGKVWPPPCWMPREAVWWEPARLLSRWMKWPFPRLVAWSPHHSRSTTFAQLIQEGFQCTAHVAIECKQLSSNSCKFFCLPTRATCGANAPYHVLCLVFFFCLRLQQWLNSGGNTNAALHNQLINPRMGWAITIRR